MAGAATKLALRAVLLAALAGMSVFAFGQSAGLIVAASLGLVSSLATFCAAEVSTARPGSATAGGQPTRPPRARQVVTSSPAAPDLSLLAVDENGIEEDVDGAGENGVGSRGACVVGTTVGGTPVFARGHREVLKPTYTLTPDNEKALAELTSALRDLDSKDAAFCDRACLCRYLRARDWKVSPAERLLRDTLKWREEYGIERVTVDDIRDELSTGKIYVHGFDRQGHPVMYQKPRRENSTNYDVQVKTVAYLLEREVCSMDLSRGVEKHALIIDFKGYSILNRPPMSVTKQVLSLLMDKFPERLGVAFLVDAPVLFQACWRVVKPFLPPETKKKIFFVPRTGTAGRHGKMADKFAEYFDDDQLEEDYGGTLPGTWDWAEFVRSERAMRPRAEAWYESGRAVKLGAEWDPKGYAPSDVAIAARMAAATAAESKRKRAEAASEDRRVSSGRLRNVSLGGVPVMSPDGRGGGAVSPSSPASPSAAQARKRLDLSVTRRAGSLSPSRAAAAAAARGSRTRKPIRPGLQRTASMTSLRSTTSSSSLLL